MADGDSARITGVTVFRDGARVVRTGDIEVQRGTRSVVVGELPDSADPASVRVAVRGTGVALLEVEVRKRYRTEPLRVDVAALRAEAEELRDAVTALEDEDAAEVAAIGFLGNLSEAAATALARAVGAGRAEYDELSRMAGHLSASTAHSLGKRREIAARKRVAQRELDAAEQRLKSAGRREDRTTAYVEVAAVVEASASAVAEVDLSYHVHGASWRPLYDLAVSGERLTVSYLAEVNQETGEDWPETALVLSTARQGAHERLPELRPWYINRAVPFGVAGGVAPGGAASRMRVQAMTTAEDSLASAGAAPAAAAPSPGMEAAEGGHLAASAGEEGGGIVYTVARPLAVPADGGPHKTLVARFDADAVLDYLTAPVLAPEAYLRATVTNGSLLLLPGKARVFHGTQFVGETSLKTVAAGEEFEVHLGVDDQIRIERKLSRRTASKAVIGGARTADIAYETTVENHRDAKVKISVHDHIPVSRDGEIKVRLREASPSPAKQDDLGELTWDLSLDPGESATIKHRFTVEHPASVTVTGL